MITRWKYMDNYDDDGMIQWNNRGYSDPIEVKLQNISNNIIRWEWLQ